MRTFNTYRLLVFPDLTTAMASNRLIGYGEVAMIAGDSSRVKFGYGDRNSAANPAAPTALTFTNLPWTKSSTAINKAPTADETMAVNITGSVTAAQLKAARYITSTSAAAVALTLPTASLLGAAIGAVQGSELDFTVDNTGGANTVTVTVNTGIVATTPAITGGATLTVAAGFMGKFKIFFKSATTALIYRVM